MFGIVSQKAYDSLALDLECERVHSRQAARNAQDSLEALRRINELIREENKSLQAANRELVHSKDKLYLELQAAKLELKDLKLRTMSMEARWGQEASI